MDPSAEPKYYWAHQSKTLEGWTPVEYFYCTREAILVDGACCATHERAISCRFRQVATQSQQYEVARAQAKHI